MNYYKTSVLTLTLFLLSTLSVFAQCGTISFGPIEAVPAGTYLQKVILNDQTLTNTLIKQR
jgi:hypothetical protein